jgi:hypothetical protein
MGTATVASLDDVLAVDAEARRLAGEVQRMARAAE